MRTLLWFCIVLVIVGVFMPHVMRANSGKKPPLRVVEYRCNVTDSAARRARITFIASTVGGGDVTLNLFSLAGNASEWPGGRDTTLHVMPGALVSRSWEITLPHDGYHLLSQVEAIYKPKGASERAEYGLYDRFPLYAEIVHGSVVSQGSAADSRFTQFPREVPFTTHNGKVDRSIASTYTIMVNVSGRISVVNDNKVTKGIPKVKVYLDWDVDGNPETYNHPVYANGASDYVYTDMDGYYSFVRQVESNVPANQITDKINVFANAYNDAAIEEQRQMGIFINRATIDITNATTSISSTNANIGGVGSEGQLGMALRNLMRARMFAINELKFTPERVIFRFDESEENSFTDPWDESITFNGFVNSMTMYHEYGHYVMYQKNAFISDFGDCLIHHWPDIINDGCAWVEGWAEFYSAAVHAYWYAKEQPEKREDDRADGEEIYQFPDGGQLKLSNNPGTCEGTVATFLYNLWDPLSKHIPNNPGDNEDLGYPRGYPADELLRQLRNAIRIVPADLSSGSTWPKSIRLAPYLKVYKDNGILPMVNRLYPITYIYHMRSINALYSFLTDSVSRQMPATPTMLTISSTDPEHSRKLVWTDSTEENPITYAPEVIGSSVISIFGNSESGFRVYRKPVLNPTEKDDDWDGRDGRLDPGYVLIKEDVFPHFTIGNVTYFDNTTLAPGRYRYVVVAWRYRDITVDGQKLHSIPKASRIFPIGRTITIRKDGVDDCNPITVLRPGIQLRLIASASGATSPTFQWLAANKPPYITLSGLASDTLIITNNYQSGTPYGGFPLFSLRCIASDSAGADTSLPWYPAYTPLDTAASFVGVRGASYFTTDSNRTRGLDFVTRPGEHVISVAALGARPVKDSSGYHVMLRGFSSGTMVYGHARLLAIDHPPGTVLRGSGPCGFKVYRDSSGVLSEDTAEAYGLVELPLTGAAMPGAGNLLASMLEHDGLSVTLDASDTLVLTFDDAPVMADTVAIADSLAEIDSSRSDWVRDYVLELGGTYQGASGSIPGVIASSGLMVAADELLLEQNRPNPFSASTTITYTLGHEGLATLALFDATGTPIRTLADGYHPRGVQSVTVDLSDLPSGIYFYRLTAPGRSQTRMLTVVR